MKASRTRRGRASRPRVRIQGSASALGETTMGRVSGPVEGRLKPQATTAASLANPARLQPLPCECSWRERMTVPARGRSLARAILAPAPIPARQGFPWFQPRFQPHFDGPGRLQPQATTAASLANLARLQPRTATAWGMRFAACRNAAPSVIFTTMPRGGVREGGLCAVVAAVSAV